MTHPIAQVVAQAKRRAINMVRLRCVLWMLSALIGLLLLVGLCDYVIHSEDIGTRWFLSLLFFVSTVLLFRKLVLPHWRWQPSDIEISQRIEGFFPQLKDRISSCLVFLAQADDDPTAGSSTLRRSVIAETTALIQEVDIDAALNRDYAKKAWMTIFGTMFIICVLGIAAPSYLATSTYRLFAPFAGINWPRVNHLAFVKTPDQVARGGYLLLEVIDQNGELPQTVEIEISRGSHTSTKEMQLDFSSNQMIYRIDNITQDLSYRAIGGDDNTMPWNRLEVLDPPKLTQVDVKLIPPKYTQEDPLDSPRAIIALEGTTVQLHATIDRPIAQAKAVYETSEGKQTIHLIVAADGLSASSQPFDVKPDATRPREDQFVLSQSGSYWLEIETASGLLRREKQRSEVRVTSDKPPAITWLAPLENLFLTPVAEIDLKAQVSDDFGTERVDLQYLRSDQTEQGSTIISLYENTVNKDAEKSETAEPVETVALASTPGESIEVNHHWDLSKLEGLAPGVTLNLTLIASDYKPQLGESLPRRITIIGQEQLQQRLAAMHQRLISKISESIESQQDARTQAKSAEISLAESEKLSQTDLSHLQNSEFTQRRVRQQLEEGVNNAIQQIDDILQQMKINKVAEPTTTTQLEDLKNEIRKITKNQLPGIEQSLEETKRELNQAIRSEETETPNSNAERQAAKAEIREKVEEIGQQQEDTVEKLDELVRSLSQWDTYRRFAVELRNIKQRQDDITQQTRQHNQEALGKDIESLTPDQRSELKQLSEAQAELSRRLDRVQSRMREMKEDLGEDEPLAAETLGDAINENRKSATSQQMREASKAIKQNQLGQSAQAQQQVAKALQEVLDVLDNKKENRLKQLSKKLEEAKNELDELVQKQKGLNEKTKQASQIADEMERGRELKKLAEQQKQLQEETERLSRKLERLQANKAAESLQRGAQQLQDASNNAEQDDAQQSLEDQAQAEQDLEQAQQELAQQQKKVEADLAQEQMARLKQSIEAMVIQQRQITEKLSRLSEALIQDEPLTLTQLDVVEMISIQQQTLEQETREFAETISKAEVFFLSLVTSADLMREISRNLDIGLLDEETLAFSQEALERLEQLLAALEEDKDEEKQSEAPDEQQPEEGQGEEQQNQQQQNQDGIGQMAQLKLLKSMQQSVNRQTAAAAEELLETGKLTPELEFKLIRLAEEQGKLAELTLKLTEITEENLFDLENLPGTEEEDPDSDEPAAIERPKKVDAEDKLEPALPEPGDEL
ncbi:MAG: hypothetical protein COA78_09355 [Blastopirellula sp.]|nr:MAG: hypothetical protein COA78_09355 [Blastopirellula sp.]